jgi:hypothetical protein
MSKLRLMPLLLLSAISLLANDADPKQMKLVEPAIPGDWSELPWLQ